MSSALVGLQAEAVSAGITLAIASLMWFAVLPFYNKPSQKKVIDSDENQSVNIKSPSQKVKNLAQNRVVQITVAILMTLMLARCLKMLGAFEQPFLCCAGAFVLGGVFRFSRAHAELEDETVEYPDNEDDFTGNDACHHSAAFWSDLDPKATSAEEEVLQPSEILADVLLPLLSDSAVSPILHSMKKNSPCSTMSDSSQGTCCLAHHILASLTLAVIAVMSLHFSGIFNYPCVILPLAPVLGGLARKVLSRSDEEACEDLVAYPEYEPEEELYCGDVDHQSAAFWSDLPNAQSRAIESVPQPSEILSDVLLSHLNDPAIASLLQAQSS